MQVLWKQIHSVTQTILKNQSCILIIIVVQKDD